jgi:Holliday junction resolvase RusA-like endonuclease
MRIEIDWNGWAVGENRRKEFSRKMGRAYPNPAYLKFKECLAWYVRIASDGARLSAPRVDFLVDAPRLDVDALVKPVLDSIQLSGLVGNDSKVIHQASDRADLRRRLDWRGPRDGPHYIRLAIEGEEA